MFYSDQWTVMFSWVNSWWSTIIVKNVLKQFHRLLRRVRLEEPGGAEAETHSTADDRFHLLPVVGRSESPPGRACIRQSRYDNRLKNSIECASLFSPWARRTRKAWNVCLTDCCFEDNSFHHDFGLLIPKVKVFSVHLCPIVISCKYGENPSHILI